MSFRQLRARAEALLAQSNSETESQSNRDVRALVHDLSVHQIELEMQNEELLQSQLSLQHARDEYQNLYNHAPTGFLTLDSKGLILKHNQTFSAMLGTASSTFIGKAVSSFMDPEDCNIFLARYRAFFKSPDKKSIDLRFRRAEGPAFWTRLSGRTDAGPVGSGEETDRLLLTVSDINKEKQAELAIENSLKFISGLLDTVPSPIFYKDASCRYLGCNRAFSQLTGLDKDKLVGRLASEIAPPEMAAVYDARDLELLDTAGVQVYEDRVQSGPDDVRDVVFYKSTYKDANGQVAGLVGVMLDITDHKKLEEERAEMERKLQHSRKLESLGVLAGGIAHDFNNLLAVIVGNLDLALMCLPPTSPARRNIGQSMEASRLAADLTRQMLAYTGQGAIQMKAIDLNEVLRTNVDFFRDAVRANITFAVDHDRALPTVVADPGQMQQVVMNLITNATEAIGSNQGTVTLSTGITSCDDHCIGKSRLEEKPEPGEFVYIKVSDDGCGMNEETQQRMFEPFFTTKFTGRGLGLAATQGIVRAYQGVILLESELGKGTTVSILFPLLEGAY